MTDPTNAKPEDTNTPLPEPDEATSTEPAEDESPFGFHPLDKVEEAELDGWDG
jgi:hypothetical protein